jgi:hypothetical protein
MTRFALALAIFAAMIVPASALSDATKICSGTPTYDADLNIQLQMNNIVSLNGLGESCLFHLLTPVATKIFAVCPAPAGFNGESIEYVGDHLCVVEGKIDKSGVITKVTKVSYVKEPLPGRDLCAISKEYPVIWHLLKIVTIKSERWAQIEGWKQGTSIRSG